ncbi:hypothetical protein BU15DRAFT_83247 [Melanogaster broomeanus]|nr:hypothetical protein BU15DRAFT_83247 [Melanogaster broomeanus]
MSRFDYSDYDLQLDQDALWIPQPASGPTPMAASSGLTSRPSPRLSELYHTPEASACMHALDQVLHHSNTLPEFGNVSELLNPFRARSTVSVLYPVLTGIETVDLGPDRLSLAPAMHAIIDSSMSYDLLTDIPAHHRFLTAISSLPGWRQTYKFAIIFIWSHIARIELQPDFDAIIELSFAHLLAHRRTLVPNWAPEDEVIYLRSGSQLGHIQMNTRLSDNAFKSSFYAAVTACGSHFLRHAHKAVRYLSIDHPELCPPWCGLLRSRDQANGIPVRLAQQFVRWDPRYGFPFLHKYKISEGFIEVDWFASDDLFEFIVHMISRTDSPACIFVQEYKEVPGGAGCGVWGPAIPNNHLLSTLISLLELQLEDYLGRFSKSPDGDHLTGVRFRHFKAVRSKLLHLFDCVDNCNIVSVGPEDCNKAWCGRMSFQQKIQEAINPSAVLFNSGPSKLEPSSAESTGLCGSSTVDPVLTIGADLEEAFDRMSKIVFGDSEGPHRPQSKYENLAQYWMDAIMIKKAAVHTLAFAQQEIESVENELSPIIGPELVQYYHNAYYDRGEDTKTAFGRYLQVLSHHWKRPLNSLDDPMPAHSLLHSNVASCANSQQPGCPISPGCMGAASSSPTISQTVLSNVKAPCADSVGPCGGAVNSIAVTEAHLD